MAQITKNKEIIHKVSVGALKTVAFLGIITVGRFVLADCVPDTICNPITSNTFIELVQAASDQIMQIGLPVAAIFIIYAGLKIVMARGNEKELGPAQDMLKWTLIGTAILLGAWALVNAVYNTMQTL